MTNIKEKIVGALVGTSYDTHELHIPKAMELQFYELGVNDLGEALFQDITIHGVRETVKANGGYLFGYPVVWDADELKVVER